MNLTPPPSQNSHAVLQLLSESSRQQCKWWERDLSNTHTQAECRRQRRLCWRRRCGSCQAVGGTSVCCDWWVMWHCHVARPGSSLPHPVTPVTLTTLHHTRHRALYTNCLLTWYYWYLCVTLYYFNVFDSDSKVVQQRCMFTAWHVLITSTTVSFANTRRQPMEYSNLGICKDFKHGGSEPTLGGVSSSRSLPPLSSPILPSSFPRCVGLFTKCPGLP